MHAYQRQRVLTFLDPESDPLGSGYHIIQSKIAIGSGGIHGKGWLQGTQSQLEFLPERHTDFIFAVFSEEFGLIGVGLLLTVYLAIVMRGLWIAVNAQHAFTKLLAGSLTLTFFVYIFVCSFILAGFIACLKISLGALFYLLIGQYNWQELADNYVYLSAIIWFPEAMLNGMAITLLITYRPHWVKTFYDKDYLDS